MTAGCVGWDQRDRHRRDRRGVAWRERDVDGRGHRVLDRSGNQRAGFLSFARALAKEDFNDDEKDAGEIGAGHRVTALYEIVPAGLETGLTAVDELKYQRPVALRDAASSRELVTVKLRYQEPEGDVSRLLSFALVDLANEVSELELEAERR